MYFTQFDSALVKRLKMRLILAADDLLPTYSGIYTRVLKTWPKVNIFFLTFLGLKNEFIVF